jgi:hypothetical protein
LIIGGHADPAVLTFSPSPNPNPNPVTLFIDKKFIFDFSFNLDGTDSSSYLYAPTSILHLTPKAEAEFTTTTYIKVLVLTPGGNSLIVRNNCIPIVRRSHADQTNQ